MVSPIRQSSLLSIGVPAPLLLHELLVVDDATPVPPATNALRHTILLTEWFAPYVEFWYHRAMDNMDLSGITVGKTEFRSI